MVREVELSDYCFLLVCGDQLHGSGFSAEGAHEVEDGLTLGKFIPNAPIAHV